MSARPRNPGGVGRWTRASLAAQVLGLALLAAVAVGLVTWLAARPGLRWRLDLTALQTNTLDPTLSDLIEKLPERATIEVLFAVYAREDPLAAAASEAQRRMSELVFVARNAHPDKLVVLEHDPNDFARLAQRRTELGLDEANVVVVEMGRRRAVLRLLRDIARVDPGNPALRVEPRLESFRGDEALGRALLEVSVGEAPTIVFTTGHGEPDLYDAEGPRGYGRLYRALVADGFKATTWDPSRDPSVPAEASVVAFVAPQQPLAAESLETLRAWVAKGGRLFAATSLHSGAFQRPGGVEDLLERFGIETLGGYVAAPVPDIFGELRDGQQTCSILRALPDRVHPVTESLWRSQTAVVLAVARGFVYRANQGPENAGVYDVLRSAATSWRDLPNAQGQHDWSWNQRLEEPGPFALAYAAAFEPPELAAGAARAEGERPVSKILALGCPAALINEQIDFNRSFVLNAFNWLAAREHRLVIRPRGEDRRVFDLADRRRVSTLSYTVLLAFPGLFALCGAALAWRRRR
jgi:hypothetical protein